MNEDFFLFFLVGLLALGLLAYLFFPFSTTPVDLINCSSVCGHYGLNVSGDMHRDFCECEGRYVKLIERSKK